MPCLTQAQSRIGWYGARRVQEGFLYHDSKRTSKVKREGKAVRLGSRLGVQSEPNPTHSKRPPMRRGRDGSHWCFDVVTGDAGWVDDNCFELDDTVRLARRGQHYCGPADVDFQVNAPDGLADAPRPSDPDHHEPRPKPREGRYVIKVKDTKVRLAFHGSGFEWTKEGDVWEAKGVIDTSKEDDFCMRCIRSDTCPVGTEGFIIGLSIRQQK